MYTPKYLSILLSVLVFTSASLFSVRSSATHPLFGGLDEAKLVTNKLDNETCLSCHGSNQGEILVADIDEDTRPLLSIENKTFSKAVHGDMFCVECHQEISDSKAQHQKSTIEKPDCATCHEHFWETIQQKDLTKEMMRMGLVVDNIAAYKESFHARPAKGGGVKASCDDCHNTHLFNVPQRGALKRTEWHLTTPGVCGAKCHKDSLKEYETSVHGIQVLEKHNPKSAVCTDCHSAHEIAKTSRDPFQLSVTKECGNCHEENFETYRGTYHGQVNTLGYAHTAKCFDCHGSHEILGADDPDSTIHQDNLMETCSECHDGKKISKATEGFVTFGPHANAGDYEKYPQMWIAGKFMQGLLLFVFAYFWVHSILWWIRECCDRKDSKDSKDSEVRISVSTDELLPAENKEVRRFGLLWRIGHLLLIISVMMLILTGMAVSYSYTDWAPIVIDFIGGPQMAGLIHRISAMTLGGIFFLHLIGVSINIYRSRQTFRWFGPDSLVPNWKDLSDAWGMFKWFVNKGERPEFDRWAYWEKFDYWAVFWGMGVIGGSGLMLAFPDVTASIFPGWVFNVVTLVHGEEAFLATVFLFTVHFFNNHFRPDKLPPPDVLMFTGTQSLEEFKRDHRVQYERLLESGELENYLVDAPSKPMTMASKILGLVLITFGLTLLIFVTIGFFGVYAAS